MASSKKTTNSKIFNKLSGYSFFLSMIAAKLRYIPITIATPYVNLIALVLNFIGHCMWYIACHFYADHPALYTQWYGFAPFKEQNAYAAFIGMGGALISIAALAIPQLAVVAAWVFVLSAIFWCLSEYHKLNNPPEEEYSESYQKSYLSYALVNTLIGITAALATTLINLYPLLAAPIITLSALTSIGLTLVAVEYWLDYTFGFHQPINFMSTNNLKMHQHLCNNSPLTKETAPIPSATQACVSILSHEGSPSHIQEIPRLARDDEHALSNSLYGGRMSLFADNEYIKEEGNYLPRCQNLGERSDLPVP